MKNLSLYFFPECPFCQKVLKFIDENDIKDIEFLDIKKDEKNKEALIEKGGKNQVPALLHDGQILYESDDIIDYLKKNK